MSLYTDATGLMWIGTRAAGVSRWNPRSWELGGYRPAWLRDRLVTAFADGPGNKVWVGTLGGGLLLFDPDTGTAVSLDTLTGHANSAGDSRVMSLLHDRRGNLWIGTMTNGVKKLGPDGRLQSIPVKPGDPHSLSAAGIMTIFETRTGELWIGTHGGGVNVLDPSTGLVRQLPFGAGAISARQCQCDCRGSKRQPVDRHRWRWARSGARRRNGCEGVSARPRQSRHTLGQHGVCAGDRRSGSGLGGHGRRRPRPRGWFSCRAGCDPLPDNIA